MSWYFKEISEKIFAFFNGKRLISPKTKKESGHIEAIINVSNVQSQKVKVSFLCVKFKLYVFKYFTF